ncbi:hypothetical protein [Secundilactobacillus silagei]|nr:hypothetical protein [Secundilactobacillus silagei]
MTRGKQFQLNDNGVPQSVLIDTTHHLTQQTSLIIQPVWTIDPIIGYTGN